MRCVIVNSRVMTVWGAVLWRHCNEWRRHQVIRTTTLVLWRVSYETSTDYYNTLSSLSEEAQLRVVLVRTSTAVSSVTHTHTHSRVTWLVTSLAPDPLLNGCTQCENHCNNTKLSQVKSRWVDSLTGDTQLRSVLAIRPKSSHQQQQTYYSHIRELRCICP